MVQGPFNGRFFSGFVDPIFDVPSSLLAVSVSQCRRDCGVSTSRLVLWGGRYGGLAGPSRRRVAALSRRRTLGTRALAGHRRVVLYSARAHRACIEYV